MNLHDPHGRAVSGIILTLIVTAGLAQAEFPLSMNPAWQSNPDGHVATGGAWADVDGDGWLDMVVANGNDMERQRIVVYYNNGFGSLAGTPGWSSSDRDYHGHLDIGDINGDGLPDIAVAVYLGPGGFGDPGRAKVYLNDGAGGFSTTPDWISGDSFYSFSLALGDADGDGDLDLACACGDDYYDNPERQRIYFNEGGTLESTPSWTSDEIDYALDAFWGDVDQDGDMDIAFCGTSSPLRVYLNNQTTGGGIATTASWENTDLPEYGNTATLGDMNGDGFPELAVADNWQLGGSGRFKVYLNNAGSLPTTPFWQSSTGGYGSNVSWIDLDFDGDRDLAAGRWWGYVRVYENDGGTLTTTPAWTSNTNSVIENLFWGDVDNDGLMHGGLMIANGTGTRTFFEIGYIPARAIDAVIVEGVPLPPTAYTSHPGNGWVSLATPPPAGAGNVEIHFAYSNDLDLGVTNWDSGTGNYVFINQRFSDAEEPWAVAEAVFARPNPFVGRTQIQYRGDALAHAAVTIHDLEGRTIRTLHRGAVASGMTIWEWDRRDDAGRTAHTGVYFARFAADENEETIRLTVLR